MNTQFLVNKQNITSHLIKEDASPEISDGEVLFRIDKYAFTSNNITYAVVGYRVKYWNFFPVNEENGLIPVWGFGTVVVSRHTTIKAGDRYYGYFPMSTHLKVAPAKISEHGFYDGIPHRQEMAPIYNYYELDRFSTSEAGDLSDFIPIIRPLFATSFLNYHFLKENSFFEASHIILTSASSKTALGLAYMLQQNKATDNKITIGLTSSKNKPFVAQTGLYDVVLTYEEIDQLPPENSIIVDLAGNGDRINKIYAHLGDKLHYASMIGLADWQANRNDIVFSKAKMFFAPSVFEDFKSKWGGKELNKQITDTMAGFIGTARKWITIQYIESYDELSNIYNEMILGKVDPSKGFIVKI